MATTTKTSTRAAAAAKAATTKATKATKPAARKAPQAPQFPKGLVLNGILSFPLWDEKDIEMLQQYRIDKGLRKPKYQDRLGATLFLNQKQLDRAVEYLRDTFIPFAVEWNAFKDGEKGLSQESADVLIQMLDEGNFPADEEFILPLRHLSEKDLENLGENTDIVAKIRFGASGDQPISRAKAVVIDEDGERYLEKVENIDDIPEQEGVLFWGARNSFRASFSFNGYEAAKTGVGAYTSALYLRTDLPMNWGGEGADAEVLDSDFED